MKLTLKSNNFLLDKNYISKQITLSLILSPIIEVIYISVAYIFILKNSLFFFILLVLVAAYYSIIYTVSQQRWLNKYSRVIASIDFGENQIEIRTTKILWKKEQNITVKLSEIKLKSGYMHLKFANSNIN